MLYKHFTEKILGLQGVLIENIKNTDNTIHVYCKLERKLHKCPCCGNFTDKIHDYRDRRKVCVKVNNRLPFKQ